MTIEHVTSKNVSGVTLV